MQFGQISDGGFWVFLQSPSPRWPFRGWLGLCPSYYPRIALLDPQPSGCLLCFICDVLEGSSICSPPIHRCLTSLHTSLFSSPNAFSIQPSLGDCQLQHDHLSHCFWHQDHAWPHCGHCNGVQELELPLKVDYQLSIRRFCLDFSHWSQALLCFSSALMKAMDSVAGYWRLRWAVPTGMSIRACTLNWMYDFYQICKQKWAELISFLCAEKNVW